MRHPPTNSWASDESISDAGVIYAFAKRNMHGKGNVKKHIKFDDSAGGLFLQMKHFKDNEWISISYEAAKIEVDKNNENKAKRSHIFKDPVDGQDVHLRPGPSGTRNKTGSFVPVKKPAERRNLAGDDHGQTDKQAWRPPTHNNMDMD